MMVAYIHESEFDYLSIGYARSDAEAAEKWIEPVRAAWADNYYPNTPPAKAWMENGFTYSCARCEHQLCLADGYCDRCSGEMDEDEERPLNAGIVFDGDLVYCGAGCQADDKAEFARRREARETARAYFLEKFPFAAVTDEWTGGHGRCECFRTDHDNACLHFTFPGAHLPQGNVFCGGCKKLWVCHGDAEAFRAAVRSYCNEPRREGAADAERTVAS